MYKSFVCKGLGSGQGNGADTPYGSFQILESLRLHSRKEKFFMEERHLHRLPMIWELFI